MPTSATKVFYAVGNAPTDCHWCATPTIVIDMNAINHPPHDARTVDHLIVRSRLGSLHRKNLLPCCYLCNTLRGALTYEEFEIVCDEVVLPHRRDIPAMLREAVRSPVIPPSKVAHFVGSLFAHLSEDEREQVFAQSVIAHLPPSKSIRRWVGERENRLKQPETSISDALVSGEAF